MEIETLISLDYPSVNPYEGINRIGEQLLEKQYLAVIDEDNLFYGVLTPSDVLKRPHNLVVDCLTKKDSVSITDSIAQTLEKLYSNHSIALPVYQDDVFVGIIEETIILLALKDKITELYNSSVISQNIKVSFINNLSHELRTPLNHILGFLDIISKLDIENFKTNGVHHYNKVRKSADHFLLVMNDLIELSRIHSGDNIKIYNDDVCIETLFEELKDYFEMESEFSQKPVTINYANPDKYLKIFTDGKKIKHILYHLIDNAVKHSTGACNIVYGYELSDDEGSVVFFVKNTGSFIDESKRKKIFDAFEKYDVLKDTFTTGLGIGLTLVNKLVTLLGGSIDLSIVKDKVTFAFCIPLEKTLDA